MHQNKFYPYLGLSYPYPGKGIAHAMNQTGVCPINPDQQSCQLQPTNISVASESAGNHCTGDQQIWQQ